MSRGSAFTLFAARARRIATCIRKRLGSRFRRCGKPFVSRWSRGDEGRTATGTQPAGIALPVLGGARADPGRHYTQSGHCPRPDRRRLRYGHGKAPGRQRRRSGFSRRPHEPDFIASRSGAFRRFGPAAGSLHRPARFPCHQADGRSRAALAAPGPASPDVWPAIARSPAKGRLSL